MESYIKPLEIRWSDLDPNFHLRHSAYYDFGAYARICFLTDYGLTTSVMQQGRFGPILFREECIFRKEIKLGDDITINVQLLKSKEDFSRWSIQHQFIKNGDQLAAQLIVDGAWMNTDLRKLTALPEHARPSFERMPKAENFEWIVK
ncbi:MAG TPA: thioesterase family protein [Chitinophagaceae bacterium]|nr:thioesterase family protein [Chitinophagaceae bacterium]